MRTFEAIARTCPRFLRRASYVIIVAMSFSGCALFSGSPLHDSAPTMTHIVQYPGETLGVISSWYTGTPRHWREIQAVNPTLDVRRIRIGQRIAVPLHLVKHTGPLRPEALATLQSQIAGKPSTSDLAWQEAEDHTYSYPVRTIPGCSDLPNSLIGLNDCANRMGQRVRVTNTSQGG